MFDYVLLKWIITVSARATRWSRWSFWSWPSIWSFISWRSFFSVWPWDTCKKRVWINQKDKQKPWIEIGQTTQNQKKKDNTIYKALHRILKTGSECMCSRRVGSSCSTCGISRVTLVKQAYGCITALSDLR